MALKVFKSRKIRLAAICCGILLILPHGAQSGEAHGSKGAHRFEAAPQNVEKIDLPCGGPVNPTRALTGNREVANEDLPPVSGRLTPAMPWNRHTHTVVGDLRGHTVQPGETLLDIARAYGLGFNELEDLYPGMDPWLPPKGAILTIPSQWIVPLSHGPELVINIAELRLYRFRQSTAGTTVETFPVGIGDLDWQSPTGRYRITSKVVDPTWTIPPSLRAKYGRSAIPPGPDNPLGGYWLGLGTSSYGIHGTDIPWSVGRLVTHGCIRLYPEDITYLFASLSLPASVRLIYEPVKIGLRDGRIYAEVHADVYGRIDEFTAYGFERLEASGWRQSVDTAAFERALETRCGVPVDVTAASIIQAAQDESIN